MNKKSINKVITKLCEMEENINKVKLYIDSVRNFNPKDYRSSELEEAKRAQEEAENEILWALKEISDISLQLIDKIDPEALREME
jgi:hypothetical protein